MNDAILAAGNLNINVVGGSIVIPHFAAVATLEELSN